MHLYSVNCKSYKNESDTNKIFNRITKTNEFKCKRVCAFRTERQAAIDNAAIAAQQEDNRQELIRQNALRLAANPEIAAARIDRQQAQEQAARDRQQAREEADRAREEADRARADAVRAREEVDAYRKSIIEAQKVIKEIKNRKRNLLTDRQFKQLSQPLYRNYGAARQADTNRWVQHTKDLRNTYINSWNHYNDSYDDSNPLWGHIDVTGEITDDIMNLIHKRRVHIDHHNRQTTRNINRKHDLALRNLYTTTSSLDQDNNFLMERNLISYSWDSINKNINIDESIPYQFSPNSIEIHCTTLKTKDNVRTITDARGNKIPSNFYGHVTLNVIGPITEQNEKDINRMGTEDYRNKIDTDNQTITADTTLSVAPVAAGKYNFAMPKAPQKAHLASFKVFAFNDDNGNSKYDDSEKKSKEATITWSLAGGYQAATDADGSAVIALLDPFKDFNFKLD